MKNMKSASPQKVQVNDGDNREISSPLITTKSHQTPAPQTLPSNTDKRCDNIPPWLIHSDHSTMHTFVSSAAPISKRNALLTALNSVYESVDSTDSTESLLAEAVKKVDTPNGVRLLRALKFATSDREIEQELNDSLSECIDRIPLRFFENSAAKGVDVVEVKRMHNRQLLQQSFDLDFDHDLWDDLAAKCENRHHSYSASDGKSNTPNSQTNTIDEVVNNICDTQNSEFDLQSVSSRSKYRALALSSETSLQSTHHRKSFESSPSSLQAIGDDLDDRTDNIGLKKGNNCKSKGLTRKISCPQINYTSQGGCVAGKSPNNSDNSISGTALPESGTQYLALVGSLLSELSPDSEVNQMYLIEIALVSSIQSLKISLDFYRYFMFHSECRAGLSDSEQEPNTQAITNHSNDRLYLQNLYLDTLEVETMLYDCLDRFRHNKGRAFATKHIQKLQKSVKKMNDIQDSLHRITSSSSSSSLTPSMNACLPKKNMNSGASTWLTLSNLKSK